MVKFLFIGTLVSLYTTFVLQSLWNWFVTAALHLPQISFWVTYGMVLAIGLITGGEGRAREFTQDQQFKAMLTALDACVPDDKRRSLNEQVAEQTSQMWAEIGTLSFGKIVSDTIALAVGWAVHVFLV